MGTIILHTGTIPAVEAVEVAGHVAAPRVELHGHLRKDLAGEGGAAVSSCVIKDTEPPYG